MAALDAAMTHTELAAMLAEDERLALSFRDSTLADEQAVAIDYYEARPFGDEEEGLSQVVTPDVAEVVDYMTISTSRTIVAGDRVVEFESAQAEGEAAAEEATAAVTYSFMKGQDGYRVIHDWIQSGLIEKIGIAKTCAETHETVTKRRGVMGEDQLAALHAGGAEIAAATDHGDGSFTIEAIERTHEVRFVDYPIPSEEFLFASRTRHEDDSDYLCHRSSKSISDLIAMGFDRDVVESLPADDRATWLDMRSNARWLDETQITPTGTRKVWLREEYKRVDLDGDGVDELVKIFRVDDVILDVEEVDENPFVVWCPFPRAHRMVGHSLADKVMDLQRIKSVILRQQLNGLYLTNNPRMYVPQECVTEDTIDDLLMVRPGGLVRGRGPNKPEPLYEPFDMAKGMTMLEYITGERESRTGITRLNQGLDADALNKTATGTALMQAQGQQMEEYVARNFAEALARLFAKKLRLMVAVGKPFPIRVDGQARTVDPARWPAGLSASARVGLGSGRKDQRLQYRAQMLDMQKEALPVGLATPRNIFKNLSAMVRDAGLGVPTDYFQDPAAQGQAPAPPAPDAAMVKTQAEAEAQRQRLMLDRQKAEADLMLERQQGQAKLDALREENALKLQLEREKAAAEAALARERMELEFSLAERRFQAEQAMPRRRSRERRGNTEACITPMRNGGALDQ
ncbi:portal protein [Sphingomonas sp. ASY06-1R]|uniref:portal protein n=1 Tax=Sphingomonas sp. ASY06-1R TaxID=3445771 RepID=UPI003FA2F1C8